ncbi:MAG: DNA primase [Acidobacteria bacterium]|nr:DNA primase [Acidobacteriota bacterium]
MGFGKDFRNEVKNQTDIVKIISEYLPLKKRGKNYVANCPFHTEKTPSFSVNPVMQVFHCFGCSAGGDVFGFIMQIERCDFVQAVKLLAEKAGIAIPQIDTRLDDNELSQRREELLEINTWALDFFQAQLFEGSEGQRALEYFEKRGITQETRQLFNLGYAPDKWDALSSFLRSKGASNSQIERSGLVSLKEQGGFYDRFRGRCIFPITDTQGRVIAFGGRILGQGEPKYLNSPETPLYTKGRNLFGLSYAKEAIRKQRFVILVEGYLDFVIPFQEGIQNIVASLGTALTEQQVKLLGRYLETPQIVVNFDPDNAGVAATKRSLEILLEQGYKVNVLSLPDGEDPDTFIRKHGATQYRQLLKKSQPYIDYILTQAMREHDISRPAGKVETLNMILPFLSKMRDRVERSVYADQIADRLKIEARVVREELKRAATNKLPQLDLSKVATNIRVLPAESRLLEILLIREPLQKVFVPQLSIDLFKDLATAPIFTALISLVNDKEDVNFTNLLALIEPARVKQCENILTSIMVGSETLANLDSDELEHEAKEAFFALKRLYLEQQINALQGEINQAQRDGDIGQATQLSLKKIELAHQIRQLLGK